MSKKQFNVTSGTELRCKNWRAEGLLRLMENVLAVGEDPDNLVVYAALGKAARDWPSHDKIVESLHKIEEDETLVVQSGKPIGILKTHKQAPVVIMANCNMVGQWAKAENFYEWEKQNLICWAVSLPVTGSISARRVLFRAPMKSSCVLPSRASIMIWLVV